MPIKVNVGLDDSATHPTGRSWISIAYGELTPVDWMWAYEIDGAIDKDYVVDFTYDTKDTIVDHMIQFVDLTTPDFLPYSWAWEFGDGGYSHEQNPLHSYSTAHEYTIKLTVLGVDDFNNVLEDTIEKTIKILEEGEIQQEPPDLLPYLLLLAAIILGSTIVYFKTRKKK